MLFFATPVPAVASVPPADVEAPFALLMLPVLPLAPLDDDSAYSVRGVDNASDASSNEIIFAILVAKGRAQNEEE